MTWDKRFNEDKIAVSIEIKAERIADLLCGGFDGGMTAQWACIVDYKYKKGTKRPNYPYVETPFLDGCAILIEDTYERKSGKRGADIPMKDRGPVYTLDRDALMRGLKIMQEKYPRHFADWLAENDDAITGDVFIQCCTLGDIVYG